MSTQTTPPSDWPSAMPDTEPERIALALDLHQPPLATMEANEAAEIMRRTDDRTLREIFLDATQWLSTNRPFEYLGSGSTRMGYTWKGSNAVVKIPTNRLGVRMNQAEVAYYEQATFYGHPVVPCRLEWLDNGLPVVVMEKVTITSFWQVDAPEKPQWGGPIDGGQIAQSAMLDGAWAAYDATYPPYQSPVHQEFGFWDGFDREYDRIVTDCIIGKEPLISVPNDGARLACVA